MSGEKVTLFDVLLGFGATLASDQSTSSYIACISCDDEAAEDLARGGGSGGFGLGRGTVNPVRYGLGRTTLGDPGPLHSLRVSEDRGQMIWNDPSGRWTILAWILNSGTLATPDWGAASVASIPG